MPVNGSKGRTIKANGLPTVSGDLIYGTFLVAFFGGLAHAIMTVKSPHPFPPILPYEQKLVDQHTTRGSADFNKDNFWLPIAATTVYLLMITVGPLLMKHRERPSWFKPVLLLWNIFLAVGSIMGAFRVVPKEINHVLDYSLDSLLCGGGEIPISTLMEENPGASMRELSILAMTPRCLTWGAGCLWIFAFIQSKIPEMVDTFFIVIGKRTPRFLHWYHHVTVLWFCWVSWSNQTPAGVVYTAMNLCVHSTMYTWYALSAADKLLANGLRPGRCLSQLVTVMQIVQMIVGSAITFYISSKPTSECLNEPMVNKLGVVIYSSYLILFVHFFITTYCCTKPKPKKKAA